MEESYLELEQDPDGKFWSHNYSEDEEWGDRLIFQDLMALPLVTITSAEELKEKIINPLLERIESRINKE